MRRAWRAATVGAVALATAASVGLAPADAADSDTSFDLTAAGGLSISVPASVDLGSAATNDGTLSSQLGTVTVTDERGVLTGSWTATVSATDFTTGGATADETIANASVDYWAGLATSTSGTVVATPGQATALDAQSLDVSRTAFSATGIVGNNAVSWNPTLVVNIPSDSVVGTYTGTVTHSVA